MSDDEQEQTIAEDLVVTKYKMGGDIANRKLSWQCVWQEWGDMLGLSRRAPPPACS